MKRTVLAIDSSLACPAFALLEIDSSSKEVKILHLSHVKTSSKDTTGKRLAKIEDHVKNRILKYFVPDEVVFEKGFNKFALATQQIQRTVGVILVTLYHYKHERIHEIAPTSVKKAITGNGKASKDDLAKGLKVYVGEVKYKTDDESDAVGVGIAFALQNGWL